MKKTIPEQTILQKRAPIIAGLYAITDPDLMPRKKLFDAVYLALAGGAAIVQYRNKRADTTAQRSEARILQKLCADAGAIFLVNDDATLAQAVGADGVHLGQGDGAVAAARALLGADAIIGQTCHASLELAQAAQHAGANYVSFGRFFPSHTKPLAPSAAVTLLPMARAVLDIPIVAIGGITVHNAPLLIAAGADAVAVIHDLFSVPDIRGRARAFRELFS